MLSSDFPRTPRPKPPAKARRQSAQYAQAEDWRSPPPYSPARQQHLPSLLGSPISATSQFIQTHSGDLQERSREELEGLLDRASSIIREREQESNNALKSRNDKLLQRIPSSGASSPSTLGSPVSSISHISYVSHIHSPSSNPPSSRRCTPPPSNRRLQGHRRRMSSNPAELAQLADQNAELLSRLADLEAESARADAAGKKRLKGLESEIAGLREELERVRAESERPTVGHNLAGADDGVAEQMESLSELQSDDAVLKMLKKLTREAKVRELKEKTRPWDRSEEPSSQEARKDFAPGNFAPGMPFTSKWVARKPSMPALSLETTQLKPPDLGIPHSPSTPSSITPTATSVLIAPNIPSPSKGGINPSKAEREHTLVSQLLLKIRELEETNSQLAADHVAARERLHNAQTETESVRQLCELISQGVDGDDSMEFDLELELVNDDAGSSYGERPRLEMDFGTVVAAEEAGNDHLADLTGFQNRRPKTLRVRSISRQASLDFSGPQRHSLRVRRTASIDSFVTAKSLVFDDDDTQDTEVEANTSFRANRERKTVLGLFDNFSREDMSLSLPGAMPRTPEPRKASLEQNEIDLSSPGKAPDSGSLQDQGTEDDEQPRSLGSELGLALHGLRPAPAPLHTRSRSIVELFQDMGTSTPVTSPSHERVASSSSVQTMSRASMSASKTKAGIQRLIEESDEFEGSVAEGAERRLLRRSSTQIPSRPSSIYSPSVTLTGTRSPPSSPPLSRRLFASPSSNSLHPRTSVSLTSHPSLSRSFSNSYLHLNGNKRSDNGDSGTGNKALSMLVEIWLWLQFALVLGVVLFSMARMGPKNFFKPSATPSKNR